MKIKLIQIVAVALCFSSCIFVKVNPDIARSTYYDYDTGNVTTESYEVSEFSAIEMKSSFNVEYVQQDCAPYVEVTTGEDFHEYVQCIVKGDVLEVKAKDKTKFQSFPPVKVVAYGPSLNSVSISGSGDFFAEKILAKDFDMAIAGSGEIDIDACRSETVSASIAGSGDISISVATGTVAASIAGSGDISISGTAESANLAIAGSGDIDVKGLQLSGSLTSKVSGSGDIIR